MWRKYSIPEDRRLWSNEYEFIKEMIDFQYILLYY